MAAEIYLDAVSDALTGAGINVTCDSADAARLMLAIDLEALPDGRVPVMVWTPSAGWRIAVGSGGCLLPGTVRYLRAGAVPAPVAVVESIRRWLEAPTSLSDVEPVYGPSTRTALDAMFTAAVGVGGGVR